MIKAWLSLTIITFSIYLPIYFLLNDSVEELKGLNLEDVVELQNANPSGVESSTMNRLLREARDTYNLDIKVDLDKAIKRNKNIDSYEIYKSESNSAKVFEQQQGIATVILDANLSNSVRLIVTFGVYEKRFLGTLASVIAPMEMHYSYNGEKFEIGREGIFEFLTLIYSNNSTAVLDFYSWKSLSSSKENRDDEYNSNGAAESIAKNIEVEQKSLSDISEAQDIINVSCRDPEERTCEITYGNFSDNGEGWESKYFSYDEVVASLNFFEKNDPEMSVFEPECFDGQCKTFRGVFIPPHSRGL